jgi:hypothetical protein
MKKALNGLAPDSILNRPNIPLGSDFDFQTDRGAIRTSKIRDFNFSTGAGGTIVLGGTANGSGELLIKDEAGNIIVQGDSAGLAIYDGNLVVQNADATTIIDTDGIISTANFRHNQVLSNTTNTTTSTSYAAVPGSSLTPFTLDRESVILVTLSGFGFITTFYQDQTYALWVQLVSNIDGSLVQFPIFGQWVTTDVEVDFVNEETHLFLAVGKEITTISGFTTLSAGTHTLSLNFKIVGSGTGTLEGFLHNYTILGA